MRLELPGGTRGHLDTLGLELLGVSGRKEAGNSDALALDFCFSRLVNR